MIAGAVVQKVCQRILIASAHPTRGVNKKKGRDLYCPNTTASARLILKIPVTPFTAS